MKKFLIMMLVVILASFSVQAWASEKGNRQGRHMDPEHRARMQERLGLTEAQQAQMREIRQNGGSREEAAAVLTDEQRQKMQQWREQNPEKARKMKQHREQQRAHRPDSTGE